MLAYTYISKGKFCLVEKIKPQECSKKGRL